MNLPEDYGDPESMNIALAMQLQMAEKILAFAQRNGLSKITLLKDTFRPDLTDAELQKVCKAILNSKKENLDFFHQVNQYLKSREGKVSVDRLRILRNMKDHLAAFQDFRKRPITFESLDYEFYESLIDYFKLHYVVQKNKRKGELGLMTSTIGKTVKELRTFIADRVRRRIIEPIDLSEYEILKEESEAIYLAPHEIKKIYQTDLTEYPHLERFKDLLVIGCLTGLRFSDLNTIEPESLVGRWLKIRQQKTGEKVMIPLREMAYQLLANKYQGNILRVTNAEMNRHIKTIGKLAGINQPIAFSYKVRNETKRVCLPKYEMIVTHTCRRSFCTNEFLAGTPTELIMKISGHRTLKAFLRYIRGTPEESAQKIEAIWRERKGELWG